MDSKALPYISLLGFLFGTSLVASRASVNQFPPETFIGLRLVLAGLGFAGWYALRLGGRTWPRNPAIWKHGAVFGLVGAAIPMVAILTSLQHQSSGLTSILLTAEPALTILLAHFLLPDERLSGRKAAGVLLAMSGAVFLAALGESGLPDIRQASLSGYLLVLLAMLCGSAMSIYVRRFMRGLDGFDVTSVRTLVGAGFLMPVALFRYGLDFSQVDRSGYLSLFYAAVVGTFLAFLVQFHNIKRFGASVAVLAAYVIPVVATLGGVLLLGETITPGIMGGMVLILSGITLINRA